MFIGTPSSLDFAGVCDSTFVGTVSVVESWFCDDSSASSWILMSDSVGSWDEFPGDDSFADVMRA